MAKIKESMGNTFDEKVLKSPFDCRKDRQRARPRRSQQPHCPAQRPAGIDPRRWPEAELGLSQVDRPAV